MRQLIASVPRGQGSRAVDVATAHGGRTAVSFEADGPGGAARDILLVTLQNDRLEPLVGALQELDDAHLTLLPHGVLPLHPPREEAPAQVTDVSHRSPLEVFLGGLQSVGSWTGFLGYAVSAGVVVWIGLHTNTVYLLTAAMLIAPFAGPAMTLALGTARGDRALVTQSVVRYFASLLACIAVAFVLSTVTRQVTATELMVQASLLSSVAVLLPLTAGAAGALNLCQSERSSLVTAAGPGMLVAASLSPPAGIIGMAAAIGEWEMARSGAYVLLLQLAGINLSGAIVFALFGLSPRGVRYARGRSGTRRLSIALTAAAVAALLAWQFWSAPDLQRSTRAQRMQARVEAVVNGSGLARLVEADVRFTRPGIHGQHTALVVAHVQREHAEAAREDVTRTLTRQIGEALAASEPYDLVPLVDVRVLDTPAR
jgi:uncharacterized membrane protein